MTLEVIYDPKNVRKVSDRNSKKWDRGSRWTEAYGEEITVIEPAGATATDTDGEVHVDLSGSLDDLKFASGDAYGADQRLTWQPRDADSTLVIISPSGAFTKGETLTGGTSGATAVLRSAAAEGSGFLQVDTIVGTFVAAETITGSVSTETATLGTEKFGNPPVDTVVLPKQRVVVFEGRLISTGVALGAVAMTQTFKAHGAGA